MSSKLTSRTPGGTRRAKLSRARLYLVTDAAPPGGLDGLLEPALAGGVDVVQLREKTASDDVLREAAAVFRRLSDDHGALFVLNDRPDLAVEVGADGVHLGQEDVSVDEARGVVGDELVIGLSTHGQDQLEAGLESPADYLCVGPVWETPTKAGRPATGLEYVRHAAVTARDKPWFAIGGIDGDRVDSVLEAGARRIVVVRAIRDAADPQAAASGLRAALDRSAVGAPQ
jgi:thiamine-phosphate pyrophosphorylase